MKVIKLYTMHMKMRMVSLYCLLLFAVNKSVFGQSGSLGFLVPGVDDEIYSRLSGVWDDLYAEKATGTIRLSWGEAPCFVNVSIIIDLGKKSFFWINTELHIDRVEKLDADNYKINVTYESENKKGYYGIHFVDKNQITIEEDMKPPFFPFKNKILKRRAGPNFLSDVEKPALKVDLFTLAKIGTADSIQAAIKQGADVNARDSQGLTPLMWAAIDNQEPEVIIILVDAGAQVNAKDTSGWTPLIYAVVSNNNPNVIMALLDAGADAKAKDSAGNTALSYAKDNELLRGTVLFMKLEGTSH